MYNYQMFFPGSSRTPVSSSSLNIENPRTCFNDDSSADRIQPSSDGKKISGFEAPCSSDENKVKSGKKGDKEMKAQRFAFQTRSQVDILDDGYRWRKYGQKVVKNSKFPRSYYRCTHDGCNVKKQIQRLAKDEEIVVTTYEGIHTHPLEKNAESFEQIFRQMQTFAPL